MIKERLGLGKEMSTFDGTILNSYLATSSMGTQTFINYRELIWFPFVLILIVIVWLLGTISAGVGVGEVLRSETLEDWENNQK